MDGRTSLHWAVSIDSIECVEALLNHPRIKTALNLRDGSGSTPLLIALQKGHRGIVDLLIAKGKAEEVVLNESAFVSLYFDDICKDFIELLLSDPKADMNAVVDVNGTTPICWAARKKEADILERLLHRADTNVNGYDSFGKTPLMWCVDKRVPSMIRMLLGRSDVDINLVDEKGRSAFHSTAIWGVEVIMQDLLARPKGAFAAEDGYGRTPLDLAAKNGNTAILKLLLEKYWTHHRVGLPFSPLYDAIQRGRMKIVRILLDYLQTEPGDWVHRANSCAAAVEGTECFELLRTKFGDWMRRNPKWKLRCIHNSAMPAESSKLKYTLATIRNWKDTETDINVNFTLGDRTWDDVHTLEIVSAATEGDINSFDGQQRTALHAAAMRGDKCRVRILVAMGADSQTKDGSGCTAAEYVSAEATSVPRGLASKDNIFLIWKDRASRRHPCSDRSLSSSSESEFERMLGVKKPSKGFGLPLPRQVHPWPGTRRDVRTGVAIPESKARRSRKHSYHAKASMKFLTV
ncbi:ankyrin [Lentithecium fluviatile CBS 122367]|uniref:Ankyrin n=1 Tax=Lentithecium fluviatile CBS 122367 TaxID=1168545 RepID=A0A6G1JAA7_9PLEO|nr:ankyrin [Lentithecium fluviatile CBS 122367]